VTGDPWHDLARFKGVKNVMTETFVMNERDIDPSGTRQSDLGAESADLLDIVRRLNHKFGVSIPRGNLSRI
jgi:acyl carrier protein